MSPRARVLAFGSATALVLAGVVCALLVGGSTGEMLTLLLVGTGLLGAVALVFLEVGLSEDRDRARSERRPRVPPGRTGGEPARRRLRRLPRRRG